MKIKLCRLCLSAVAAVSVSAFAFADGGPNASKAVDGKSLALEEFQGSDTLMNRAWQFRLGDDASWASVDCAGRSLAYRFRPRRAPSSKSWLKSCNAYAYAQ